MMDIKPIRNEADYRAALQVVEQLMLAQPDLTEQQLLPLLTQWQQDKAPLQQMAAKARACALDNATAQVVAQCQHFAGQQVVGQHL